MATEKIEGQLEIDHERGVIYFHQGGVTKLRISGLPKPIPKDITLDIGVIWESRPKATCISCTWRGQP